MTGRGMAAVEGSGGTDMDDRDEIDRHTAAVVHRRDAAQIIRLVLVLAIVVVLVIVAMDNREDVRIGYAIGDAEAVRADVLAGRHRAACGLLLNRAVKLIGLGDATTAAPNGTSAGSRSSRRSARNSAASARPDGCSSSRAVRGSGRWSSPATRPS